MARSAPHQVENRIASVLVAPWRACLAAAFIAAAIFAIQYEENVAPKVGRVGDAFSAVADLGRRLASLSL